MEEYQQLQEMYKVLHRDYYALIEQVDMLEQRNIQLRNAITSAISYLACMDRISDKESNEQLAMDVLNKALGGCFQNGNSHGK